MTREITIQVDENIFGQLSTKAVTEGSTVEKLLERAAMLLLDSDRRGELARRWSELSAWGEQQSKDLGLDESDIPRLIAESRRER
jgi:hypothetical protein